ncbi:MAG: hypothetical protein D8M57_19850 [Candidatus Scalindua sp. AMX11]|nr:hypothetical protein [Planctomycetota bacterium]RZV60801.1 MAG: hypothetical protein EX341_19115 [Candidatus Scalindua sp. SCAELEC01]TDE63139.1 MAG: hypothetical protein D8M57_19850 [Candidatus Scalindua sp. AMX11]GJQ57589.1 MAG: hypothetical protein SCALA701_03900 [Candidatus Scalindua sp.]
MEQKNSDGYYNSENNNTDRAVLDCKQQLICFTIGIINGFFLFASVVYIVLIICWDKEHNTCFSIILAVSAIGGVFGGSLRALMMLIIEVGQKKKGLKPVDYYLTRWPLFILKPFLGLGTGILFFLSVKFGIVMPLAKNQSGKPTTNILAVFFLSAIGGFFFEEVISIIGNFMNTKSKERTET